MADEDDIDLSTVVERAERYADEPPPAFDPGAAADLTQPRVLFEVIRTTQRDPYAEKEEKKEREELPEGVLLDLQRDPDAFGGKTRVEAKTTILRGRAEEFSDLGELLDSLPSDEEMRDREPRITRDTPRVGEERRNVRVWAYLWAATKPGDNDYHLIIGRNNRKPTRFMNVEISGLPEEGSPHYRRLERARRTFEDFVRPTRLGLPNRGGYDFYVNPRPRVVVEGSLFFDAHHTDEGIGPESARPRTVWEIHPVSAISFPDVAEFATDLTFGLDADAPPADTVLDVETTDRMTVIRTNQKDPGEGE